MRRTTSKSSSSTASRIIFSANVRASFVRSSKRDESRWKSSSWKLVVRHAFLEQERLQQVDRIFAAVEAGDLELDHLLQDDVDLGRGFDRTGNGPDQVDVLRFVCEDPQVLVPRAFVALVIHSWQSGHAASLRARRRDVVRNRIVRFGPKA